MAQTVNCYIKYAKASQRGRQKLDKQSTARRRRQRVRSALLQRARRRGQNLKSGGQKYEAGAHQK
jgi:hypothetical protein